jgi:hypothetical protein
MCVVAVAVLCVQPLMLHSTVEALLDEIHSLAYLAARSNRSLIVPNILIGTTKQTSRCCRIKNSCV